MANALTPDDINAVRDALMLVIEPSINQIDHKIDVALARFDLIDEKLINIEERMARVEDIYQGAANQIDKVVGILSSIDREINGLKAHNGRISHDWITTKHRMSIKEIEQNEKIKKIMKQLEST